jgi:LDH2 family malate/lactate/ureidoglycolate dehydrogenase
MDGVVEMLKSSPPMKGFDRIRIPGERSSNAVAENRKNGIAIDQNVLEELDALAIELGVQPLSQ